MRGRLGQGRGSFRQISLLPRGAGEVHICSVIALLCETARDFPNSNLNPLQNKMKRIITTIAALAVSAVFVHAADAAADAKKPEGGKKHGDPEEMWKKIAGDKESVTKEEFTAHAKKPEAKTKAEALFDKKDANKDGKLTKEEFMAHGKKAK